MGEHAAHQREYPLGAGLVVSSNFDSGNICDVSVEKEYSLENSHFNTLQFSMRTSADCENTAHESKNRSWFYFSVTGVPQGTQARFRISNMNKQVTLYSQGMRPVYRTSSAVKWARIPDANVGYSLSQPSTGPTPNFTLTFHHTFLEASTAVTYFAFCYPFPYAALQEQLAAIDKQKQALAKENVYFERQAISHSLQGRRIELLTVSSMPQEREKGKTALSEKRVVIVSARVHPGETPSSFILNGFLQFLLEPNSQRAAALRRNFVFYFIPMLNPDGVAHGHYRTNLLGMNLNRFYDAPEPKLQPSIFAAKKLAMTHARRGKLYLYLDLHAHANKRGIFLYGNHLPSLEAQVENVLFGELVSKHCKAFEPSSCNYSLKNMKSSDKHDRSKTKESSCRVAMYAATQLVHCYTLETNYNRGTKGHTFYTPKTWQDCGKACANAILDLAASQQTPLYQGLSLSRSKHSMIEQLKQTIRNRLVRMDTHYSSALLQSQPPQVDMGTKNTLLASPAAAASWRVTSCRYKPPFVTAKSRVQPVFHPSAPSHPSREEHSLPHLRSIYSNHRQRKRRSKHGSKRRPKPTSIAPTSNQNPNPNLNPRGYPLNRHINK